MPTITPKKTALKKLGWHLLMVLCVVVYAAGLAVVCEAAARQEFSTFREFVRTDMGILALRNTAILSAVLILMLYFLTTKISAAMALVSIPLLLVHLINAFKLHFRNEPFYPWDITLAGEATNILSGIHLTFSKPMLLAIGYVLIALAIGVTMDLLVLRKNRPRYQLSLICCAVCTAVFGLLGSSWFSEDYIQENSAPVWVFNQAHTYQKGGFVYAFAANYYHGQLSAPEDYSPGQIEALTDGYTGRSDGVQPNVIIIMSEAFSDIWNAKHLTFDEPLAPTFTALSEQYLSGNCMTSEYGGNTANCEFEVLTGFSTCLLPSGTVPYMSYLNQTTDNYVSFLKSEGYYTLALHPYHRSFFSREKAYELMGFDDYYSEEHFDTTERLRVMGLISDDVVADRIISEFEQNQASGKPFFCHTVTMLNHTSYYGSDWPDAIQVGMTADCALEPAEYRAIRSYATGVQFADAMLAKLVDYFSQVEEPTVLLFFGDHQPSLGSPGYELMQRIGYVDDNTTPAGTLALQSTPYLIWNNFEDTPTHARTDMSMFHLVPYMTRTLGMNRPAYHAYMDELFTAVPGATRSVCLTAQDSPVFQLPAPQQECFDDYLTLVYDLLVGKQYASEALYP